MSSSSSRNSLLHLYRNLLRACQTYPSKKRASIYQAIREEWRESVNITDAVQAQQKIAVAQKGLSQLLQYSEDTLTGGQTGSANWQVTLEQNPMPKPADYEKRK